MEDKWDMTDSPSSEQDQASSLPLGKPVLARVFHPPKLERKHSSGDLHSRLKTRKILGVGETDNGDIHRSKISQVLGHNEHLYLKLPKGYRTWQSFLSIILIGQAVMIVVLPQTAWKLGIVGISGNSGSNSIATHYYAASLLALSFLLWKINMNDKGVSRSIQTASVIHFAFLFVVDFLHGILSEGIWSLFQTSVIIVCVLRLGIVGICLMYLKRMGTATSGLRRSPSYKEILERHSTY